MSWKPNFEAMSATQRSENDGEQREVDFLQYIKKGGFRSKQVEEAYLCALAGESVDNERIADLSEKIAHMLNDGFAANRMLGIIDGRKNFDVEYDAYIKEVSGFSFDRESIQLLIQAPINLQKGIYVGLVNDTPVFEMTIDEAILDATPEERMEKISKSLREYNEGVRGGYQMKIQFFER